MITESVIEAPAPPIDKGYEYARLVEIAIRARQALDINRWTLGDCAAVFETHYRDETLARFANDIKVDPKTLYGYKVMSEFYTSDHRERIAELNLTHTHAREARRLGTVEKAMEFLELAAANLYSVPQTRVEIKLMLLAGKGLPLPDVDAREKIYTPPMLQNLHPIWEGILTAKEVNGRTTLSVILPDDIEKDRPYKVIVVALDE